ncbi:glycosyltransferase family 8 protein [Micromonospora sp. M61]|uniref:glycosyltransferase family 8 protein n=1 Tax=Micromonospora sp. M61 TaxID=2824890 RepID=UPI001B38FE19|nr:glycosyltransferase family 8 protein [Micromonospora sp. M61]MBQ0977927.1 glycosyltransferase family 8 protein [Micromonospora sp. M61]
MNSDRQPFAVVLAVDDSYALPAAVTIRSLVENLASGTAVEFVVLDLGISAAGADRLRAAAAPHPLAVEHFDTTRLADLPVSTEGHSRQFSTVIFGYLYLPVLLADRYERLLYLDADILVVADVSPLLRLDLAGRPVAGVPDWGVPTISDAQGVSDWAELGLAPDTRYLNSGLLVIDVDRWLAADLTRSALAYAGRHSQLDLPDQQTLNAVLHGDFVTLGREWNFIVWPPLLDTFSGPVPRIWHFAGRFKPWTRGSRSHHHQLLYQAYAELVGWRPMWLTAGRSRLAVPKQNERVA